MSNGKVILILSLFTLISLPLWAEGGDTGITKVIGCTECTPVPVTGGQLCCTELATHPKGVRSDATTSRAVCEPVQTPPK